MFAAVLDTNVPWPSLQRDFLLSMAIEGLYRPLWSSAILDELHRHEQQKLIERGRSPAAAAASAKHLLDRMSSAFNDAEVHGWEPLDGAFGLPDPDDEHLVAAAVIGGAGVIVTDNLKDFPPDRLPEALQVSRVRDFAADTADVNPELAAQALFQLSARRTNPGHTSSELLELLIMRYGMDDLAEILRPLIS